MKTLYQQYREAREERKAKYQEYLESKTCLFDELSERLQEEELRLVKIEDQYAILTPEGDEVCERFEYLEDVENWLDDPEFSFDFDDDDDDDDDFDD